MQELIVNIAPNLASKLPDFYKALGDTMLMVLWSGLISFVFGLLLGVVLTVTKPNGILENKVVYQILDKLVSLFRSIPFIILLTWVMPITRALVGTVLYVRGAIVPLVFGSVPFFTRQVESALAELDGGLIEAALSMGSMGSTWPMTPVEATTTSWGSMPRAWAAKSHMAWAFSTPSALQVLALPELQMTALAAPSAMFFWVTRMGAPFTRFWVYTAAAAQGFSL